MIYEKIWTEILKMVKKYGLKFGNWLKTLTWKLANTPKKKPLKICKKASDRERERRSRCSDRCSDRCMDRCSDNWEHEVKCACISVCACVYACDCVCARAHARARGVCVRLWVCTYLIASSKNSSIASAWIFLWVTRLLELQQCHA